MLKKKSSVAKQQRRKLSAEFKAKVALAALREDKTLAQFVERLWRSVKYERVYLRAYESVSDAKADIAAYIEWYNTERGHTSLEGNQTPDAAYWRLLPKQKIAA